MSFHPKLGKKIPFNPEEQQMFRRWQAHHRKRFDHLNTPYVEQQRIFLSELDALKAKAKGTAHIPQESITVSAPEVGEEQPKDG